MSIQTLISVALGVSIFLTVLTVGMRIAPGDLSCLLIKPARLVRPLLAMNILGPIVTVAVCKMFSLHPAVIVALVTLSIAPVGASSGAPRCPPGQRVRPPARIEAAFCAYGAGAGSLTGWGVEAIWVAIACI